MRSMIVAGIKKESPKTFEVRSPYDGSLIDEIASAQPDHVEDALAACERARDKVRSLTRFERAGILRRVSQALAERREELAKVLASEVGKTLKEARTEVDRASTTFGFAAEEATRLAGEVIPFDAASTGVSREGYSIKVPIGTIIAITPFNFPLNLAAHKVAPAIAAGNPFILKPASQTPIADLILGEIILEAGFPGEALSVLPGPGGEVGLRLVSDDRPRMVTFTGSADVGKEIARSAGFKKIAMELGSNSAVIVTQSGDLDFATIRIVQGAFALAGQVCISVQRVVAHRDIFDQVVERVSAQASGLKIGNPLEEQTQMGPMISEKDAQRIEAWIDEAVDAGAQVVAGGTRKGSLFSPTVLKDVNPQSRVWKDEAFAPIVCINSYTSFEEAIRIVNESRYGLQAGVFTQSVDEAFTAAAQLHVGGVIINDVPTYRVDQMPYGGVKDSGIGREGLKYAIAEMTEEKLVCFNFWRPH